jgi:glycosyltransferase involved in cell wall biosynthesis
MKALIIDVLRSVFRALPFSPSWKRRVQDICFTHFPFLFRHLPGYQIWSLQNPERQRNAILKLDLPATREEALAHKAFAKSDRPGILMITHSLGGGTEHHVKQLSHKLKAESVEPFVLRSLGGEWVQLTPYDFEGKERLIYHRETELEKLIAQLKLYKCKLLHVHHLVDFGNGAQELVQDLSKSLAIPYDFTVHDYLPICPRYTLYDDAVRGYCGEPKIERCSGCVKTFGSAAGKEVDISKWREHYENFLNQARQIYTPDEDVLRRLKTYLPKAKLLNRPHWDESEITPLLRDETSDRPLRILCLGAIAPHKGSMILKECAEDAKRRNLPLEFTLIGFSDIDWQLKKVMTVTGPYKMEELPTMLKKGAFDIAFLPAVWPETFNYTLSEILHYGIFPVSFDIGAIARRIKSIGWGKVLPYKDYRNAKAINNALLELNITVAPVNDLAAAQQRYSNYRKEYYQFEF